MVTGTKKVVIAPQGFKGSISANEAGLAIEEGVKRALKGAKTTVHILADGGHGTIDVFEHFFGGKRVATRVMGPLGEQKNATFLLVDSKPNRSPKVASKVAVVEMAEASGIAGIPYHKRNASKATTFGTGELVKKALDLGVKEVVLGVGGSATNDGGAGMVQALGARFTDQNGDTIAKGGASLVDLHQIDMKPVHKALKDVSITVLCDVSNPLLGKLGATTVYGPQKGAKGQELDVLESALANYASVVKKEFGKDLATVEGGGAGGGIAAGAYGLLGANLKKGAKHILDVTKFDLAVKGADLLIVAEGGMDSSSQFGKCVTEAAKRAKLLGTKKVVGFGGKLGDGWKNLHDHGIDAMFSISTGPMRIEQSMANTSPLLSSLAEEVLLLLKVDN